MGEWPPPLDKPTLDRLLSPPPGGEDLSTINRMLLKILDQARSPLERARQWLWVEGEIDKARQEMVRRAAIEGREGEHDT